MAPPVPLGSESEPVPLQPDTNAAPRIPEKQKSVTELAGVFFMASSPITEGRMVHAVGRNTAGKRTAERQFSSNHTRLWQGSERAGSLGF